MEHPPANHQYLTEENLATFEREGIAITRKKFSQLTRGQKLAQVISLVLAPNVVCPFVFIWFSITYHTTPFWLWTLGAIYFYGLHPLVLLIIFILTKRGDIYLTDRRQRFWPMVSAILGYIIFLSFIWVSFGWGNLLTRIISGSTLLSVGMLVVSLRWKISIHATGNSVGIMGLAVLNPMTMWVTLPLHALVIWVRRKVKAHTVTQLLVGTALGIGIPLSIFYVIP
ncbi:MAG: hypothetical protein RBG13Loki_2306 [Promethearchaeota archaeon CR_4]|nr:MAG: hypothetical protein RBG13Loki_2306 [Candidatus Lokiarchaeota archaeon CR_4]